MGCSLWPNTFKDFRGLSIAIEALHTYQPPPQSIDWCGNRYHHCTVGSISRQVNNINRNSNNCHTVCDMEIGISIFVVYESKFSENFVNWSNITARFKFIPV